MASFGTTLGLDGDIVICAKRVQLRGGGQGGVLVIRELHGRAEVRGGRLQQFTEIARPGRRTTVRCDRKRAERRSGLPGRSRWSGPRSAATDSPGPVADLDAYRLADACDAPFGELCQRNPAHGTGRREPRAVVDGAVPGTTWTGSRRTGTAGAGMTTVGSTRVQQPRLPAIRRVPESSHPLPACPPRPASCAARPAPRTAAVPLAKPSRRGLLDWGEASRYLFSVESAAPGSS